MHVIPLDSRQSPTYAFLRRTIMKVFNSLPDQIKTHLQGISAEFEHEDREAFLESLAENWERKKELFEKQTTNLDLHMIDTFDRNEERPVLMLTFSGSLITLGPKRKDTRWVEYASIKLRTDVPGLVVADAVSLETNVSRGETAAFATGPLKKTSAVYQIAVCEESVPINEQEKRIKEAAIFLTNGFVKLNRTLDIPVDGDVEQFNMRSMINYISRKNDVTQTLAKGLIEDFLTAAETGLLLGERVSFGRLGNADLKLRGARSARVIKNPQTGEEMTIPAKPAMMVPKFNFSSKLKEKISLVEIPDQLDPGENYETDED